MQNIARTIEQISETKSERQKATEEIKRYFAIAGIALKNGGEASFEWPSNHSCWALGPVAEFIHQHQCYSTTVGNRRFACTSHRLSIGLEALDDQMTAQFHQSQPIDVEQGGAATEFMKQVNGSKQGGEADQPHDAPYPLALCRTILSSLFGYDNRVYMMPCKTTAAHQAHREKSIELDGFELSPNGISFERRQCIHRWPRLIASQRLGSPRSLCDYAPREWARAARR